MVKTGFVFPGQGSQFVGMGAGLCGQETFRKVFTAAGRVLGRDLLELCLKGPREDLDRTLNTQLAVLAFEIALLEILRERGLPDPMVMAGHSLGEYSAVYAAGALSLEQVFEVVSLRAKRHEEAVPAGSGAMAAVTGLPLDVVKHLLEECSGGEETIELANINTPNQSVVSGHARAVERVVDRAREAGARMVVRLPISVPCHCRLMAKAAARFAGDLDGIVFRDFRTPVIPNCDPSVLYTSRNAAELMSRQIVSIVRWQETIERMSAMGVGTIVEIGPKRVLSGLIRTIRPEIKSVHIGDASFESLRLS